MALALFTDRRVRRSSAPDRTSQSGAFEEIDAHIERQMERLNMPGVALAIVEGDKVVYLRGFGRARPGGEEPTPQTPFIIGSLTKSFTALAVMQLVEEGKIDLDAPVQHYLPWFRVADPWASAQITVRHLLNQTSGLPTLSGEIQLADLDDRPDASERQARALSTLELTRPVGSAFEYSNANYSLLGLIVEAASGESYADYVQNHIFAPLKMTHSYTSQDEAKQNGLAVGHQYWFVLPFATPNMPIPHGSLPAAVLISTSEDMARYLIAHLNEGRYGDVQILSGSGVEELHRGRQTSVLWAFRWVSTGWGGSSVRSARRSSSGTPALSLTLVPTWCFCQSKTKASSYSSMPAIIGITPSRRSSVQAWPLCWPANSLLPARLFAWSPGRCVASCSFRSSRLEASSPRCASYAAGAWSLSTARAVDARGGFMCCSR